MYLVLRHVGGSRDSGTGCALVGVSRYNFYQCIFPYYVLYLYRINKFLPSFLPVSQLGETSPFSACVSPFSIPGAKSNTVIGIGIVFKRWNHPWLVSCSDYEILTQNEKSQHNFPAINILLAIVIKFKYYRPRSISRECNMGERSQHASARSNCC